MPDDHDDHAELVTRLFTEAVPEIALGVVAIKAVARRPRVWTKVAVHSDDEYVDCLRACVGPDGSRAKRVSDKLPGEKLDIVRWSASPDEMIRAALKPGRFERVSLDEASRIATVVVAEDQLSVVIGRRDVNRDLASQLCGWTIRVVAR